MKDEFTYYTVTWILEKEIKSRKFYNKKEALKWNELLPDLPLYSNQYHDFYNSKVKNWETSEMKGLTSTILDAWVTE